MFNRKLKFVPGGIDFPVWVTDDEFDIDRHVHRMAVPSPGSDRELSEVAGHLAGIPLDRSRPLWEMHVIEGLANGKIAIFSKMHHASVDGVSGSNMISYLCSLEPDAPPLDSSSAGPPTRSVRHRAGRARSAGDGDQAVADRQAGGADDPHPGRDRAGARDEARRWLRR